MIWVYRASAPISGLINLFILEAERAYGLFDAIIALQIANGADKSSILVS